MDIKTDGQAMLELMKQNELNNSLENTFFELQRSIDLIVKQTKYAYDCAIAEGFDEKQALEVAIRMFKN